MYRIQMDMPLPLPLPEPKIIMPLLSRRPVPVLQPVSLPLPRGAESLAQSGQRQPLELWNWLSLQRSPIAKSFTWTLSLRCLAVKHRSGTAPYQS